VSRICPSAAGRLARGFLGLAALFEERSAADVSVVRGMSEVYERTPGTMRRVKARKLLDRAVKTLKASASIDHWQKGRERIEAEDLLMHAMRIDQEPDPAEEITGSVRRRFEAMIDRRATGEPIPLIKGYTEFRGLELIAEPGVFVPRDSSEFLAEQAVRRLRKRTGAVHVDLATGGGTIALAVANEAPKTTVYGADLSADAVTLARRNARRLGLMATFRAGDMFAGLPKRIAGTVDVITLHPPYVPLAEVKDLPDEIRNWEPTHTLTDRSDDGLGLVVRAADESQRWLRRGGWLLIEVSPDRAKDVMKVMRRAGLRDVRSTKGGELKVTRVVVGRR
jgi:release factor glutamine methyltransferase